LDRRLREAARLGFKTAVVPRSRHGVAPEVKGISVIAAGNLREAIGHALGAAPDPDGRAQRG
jgi:predicted ATP-dependent serine protease